MRAHQIMTRSVISVTPDTSIVEAANIMLKRHVSGLTVVNDAGKLVGVVSEGDFIRRSEIGTGRKRGRWLRFILGPSKSASDFVHEHGRKVAEVMTASPVTITEDTALAEIVDLMERNNVKRLPVVRGDKVVGIVSRANLLQAVAHRSPQRRHHRGAGTAGRSCRRGDRRRRQESARPSLLGRHDVRRLSEFARGRRSRQGELRPNAAQRGMTAVASISTRAAFSTRRTTWRSAIAG